MQMKVRTKCLGYRGVTVKKAKVMAHTLQERQGSVLTNQCLEKEMNAERGAEESFLLTDSDKLNL
jgi:hypothetical protein